MKILIINPPIRLTDKPRNIPHGLALLANIIRRHFKCTLYFADWNALRWTEKQFTEVVKNYTFDMALVGGLIPTYRYLLKISEIVKKLHPACKIIAGGSAAMSIPEILLENSKVDVVCTGEGEVTIIELLRALQQEENPDLSEILGVAYRDSDGGVQINAPRPLISDLDVESDLPAYDLLPMDIYLSNPVVGMGKDIDFISSRGCPFDCTFCYQPWGCKNRRHSAEFIKDAILFLVKRYKINFVSFQDDLFIANRQRVYEFCELRNMYFPEIYWSCTGRANICDDELVSTIRKSGCTLISYGFESGSPRILQSMRKKIDLDQMELAVKLNRKYDLPIPVSFILGMPGEDDQSCEETIQFCKKNNLNLNSLMYATPYPGTELFKFALKSGKINRDGIHNFVMRLGDARDFVINLTDSFTDDELKQKYRYMITETNKSYRPVSHAEMDRKIKALYGSLSSQYFSLSDKDRQHRAKHGGINMF